MTINGFPAMSWNDFINIPNGETVFNYGRSQCSALANLYTTSVLGQNLDAPNIPTAWLWWVNRDAVAAAWDFTPVTSNPQVGDVFIASGGAYAREENGGHIGVVVRAWDGNTFGTMEQNVLGQFVSRHDRTMQNIDGFLRTHNQAAIGLVPAVNLAGNQRQAGPLGVFRRAEPNQQSEHLEGDLEAGDVGNFNGWIHGENRDGNDIWFQGISGNWFWSGAFTNPSPDGINDLNTAQHAPAVEPAPIVEPEPAPAAPEPIAEPASEPLPVIEPTTQPAPAEPTPAIKETPVTPEEIQKEKDALAALPAADLGVIIPSAKGRKVAYASYALLALIVGNVGVGFAAAGIGWPVWLVVSVAIVNNLALPFGALALANASNTSK